MRRQSEAESFAEFWDEEYLDSHNRKVPMKWEICDRCRGEGKHTNPSIDGNGLPQEYVDDPDFMEEYLGGMYDVPCEAGCKDGKIKTVDEEAMPPEMKQSWESWLRDAAETEAIYRMERMMGA